MEGQELLNKLMQQELLELKRMCFKYKHDTPFIRNDIIIEFGDLSNASMTGGNVLGIYEKIKGKHDYDFSHKITISKSYNYLYRTNPFGFGKRYYIYEMKKTIRHELIHAFVTEHYETWSEIKGTSGDSSPIFLSVLFYLKGHSDYDFVPVFKRSDMFQKVKSFRTFNELDAYLSHLIIDYQQIIRKHKKGYFVDKNYVINEFIFSAYNAGLNNRYQNKLEFIKPKSNLKVFETNIFEIGCCIMPDQIEELVNKKRYTTFQESAYKKCDIVNDKLKTVYKEAIGM